MWGRAAARHPWDGWQHHVPSSQGLHACKHVYLLQLAELVRPSMLMQHCGWRRSLRSVRDTARAIVTGMRHQHRRGLQPADDRAKQAILAMVLDQEHSNVTA